MASVSKTWSPNSFQLRSGINCKRSSLVLLRMRVGKLDRPVRVLSVAADSAKSGNGAGRRPTVNLWMNSDSSADAFSGWSGTDGGEGSVESQWKRRFGGIVGAAVAGAVLVAGLTFATLSMRKQNPSRLAKEMEPLTTKQEVSLASDDQDDRAKQDDNEGKDMMWADSCLSKTGIDNDYLLPTENNEAINESKRSGYSDLSTFHSTDAINNASTQEDLQKESTLNDTSIAPETSLGAPELSGSKIADDSFGASDFENSDSSLAADKSELGSESENSFVASNFENSDRIVVTEKSESATELKENLINAERINLSVSDANPTILSYGHQEGVSATSGTENSNFSYDLSSSSTAYLPSEALPLNISVNSPLDAILEPKDVSKENLGTVELLSTREELDLSKTQVLAEDNKSSSEDHNLYVDRLTETTSASSMAYPFTNQQDTNTYRSIDGRTSIFESANPRNSLSSVGIPAPSVLSAALQVIPGKVLVPPVIDQVQGQALTALQVLKVIEAAAQPGDLCTRREYARWLVSASSTLSRNTVSKVYPAMYIENVTELAFDDVTPEDPDFPSIQGLAEAGLISSKLSRRDMFLSDEDRSSFCFSPESPLSRQDLVSWKMALEKRQLPEADRKILQQLSGFIDIDKINPDAWPALVADLSAGENGIIALAFGYTRLFQPDKPVTKAQAAIALATGEASDIVSEELARIEAESMAEKAVAAHSALVAEVEKDINASFEKELLLEREKIHAVEKLAEAAQQELERLRAERQEGKIALMKERAAVESEMEVLSRLRHEVEEQLESLMSNKVEISYEKERLNKLRKEAEIESQEIARLQYELEVERKALSMARAWAEDEAKRAREQAKVLEEARERWERHGIKVVVDDDLREEANVGVTWLNAGKQLSVEKSVSRAENLVDKLKGMAADVRGKAKDTISRIIQVILSYLSALKEWACRASQQGGELKDAALSKMDSSLLVLQQGSTGFTLAVKEGAARMARDCRDGVEKLTQRFKS